MFKIVTVNRGRRDTLIFEYEDKEKAIESAKYLIGHHDGLSVESADGIVVWELKNARVPPDQL